MQLIIDDFRNWLHRPFRSDMDWLSLFLAVGLVLVIAAFWSTLIMIVT